MPEYNQLVKQFNDTGVILMQYELKAWCTKFISNLSYEVREATHGRAIKEKIFFSDGHSARGVGVNSLKARPLIEVFFCGLPKVGQK